MAVTFVCPKGDQSEDADYCSVCGVKMDSAAGSARADPSLERCPSCGVVHTPGARYCETCRYDFKLQSAESGVVAPPPIRPPATSSKTSWEAVVTVDPTLDVEPDQDAPCPVDTPERTFPLDLAENLVGRRSAARGILPSIALNDPGVSHRHLMVYRGPDGMLMALDLDSTNGTYLNGSSERLEPGVKTAIADGDRLDLGRWTRITFRQST